MNLTCLFAAIYFLTNFEAPAKWPEMKSDL